MNDHLRSRLVKLLRNWEHDRRVCEREASSGIACEYNRCCAEMLAHCVDEAIDAFCVTEAEAVWLGEQLAKEDDAHVSP